MQKSLDTNQEKPQDARLYTVAQLRRRMDALHRASLLGLPVLIAGMWAFYAVFGAIYFCNDPVREGTPQPVLSGTSLTILFFLSHFLIFGSFWMAMNPIIRRCSVTCPHCGKRLDVGNDFSFAIAFQCCPYCQNALFQEGNARPAATALPDATNSIRGELPFADISETKGAPGRAMRKGLPFALAGVAVVVLLGIASAALWVGYHRFTTRYGSLAPVVAPFIAKVSALLPVKIVTGVVCFWVLLRCPRAYPKCGGCGTRIFTIPWIRASGNCKKCGRRLINDAPFFRGDDDPPEFKRIEHAELATWFAQYQKWFACSVVIIFGMGSVLLGSWWLGIALKTEDVTFGELLVGIVGVNVGMIAQFMGFDGVDHCLKLRRCCPYCKRSLLARADLVRLSGNCSHCGRRVLASANAMELHAQD